MSDRPPRTRAPPKRLQNEQAAEAAATRTATRRRTVKSNTTKPKTVARNGTLPRIKGTLISRLIPLISQVTNDVDLQNFLISIYDETSNDEYTKSMFGGETEDEAKRKIAVHVDLFSKKLYRGSQPQMSFTLKGDDMINLAYLMYLDMLHDETIKKDMTFQTFCKENINVSVKVPAPTNNDKKATKMEKKIQKSPVYILFGRDLEAKETDFIKKIQSVVRKDKAEASIKANLPSIYPNILKKEMTIRKDQVSSRILTPGHNMFLSVDQEDEKATVTLDIQRTKYQLSNGTEGKIMYPLVSVANLMDPGRDMLIESAKEDSKYFMLGLNNRDIRSRLTWNYKQPEFTINHDNGSTTIGAYYTNEARITNNANKNRKTKRGYAYLIKNNKSEYRFPSNMSKAKAQTGSTGEKVAKFLGDFLQALTVVSYIKNNNNPKYHYCLATGDAMLANNFIFLCSRSGVSPNLWMATSTKQVSKVYGKMIEHIRIVKPAPTEVRNALGMNEGTGNKNQEATSGNNRSNSNNRQRNVTPVRMGARASTYAPSGTPAASNNNRSEGSGNSTGFLGGLFGGNKKQNANSNSTRSPKAVSNNNKQLSAKRVNRNALIQKLKKKNLPNFVVNGLIRSYDNKKRTANQIIRDANNFGQTFKMGQTAQRVGTLRRR
jgi:hypothetical protein